MMSLEEKFKNRKVNKEGYPHSMRPEDIHRFHHELVDAITYVAVILENIQQTLWNRS